MKMQADLFTSPLIPGLRFEEDAVTPAEEKELIHGIDAIDLSPFRFQGWTGKRLTASFGWRYDFEDASFGPTDPIPDFLLPMRFRRRRPDGFDRVKIPLPPRSIYHLSGEVRHQWEHSIVPMEVPRWSVTFRSLAIRS